MYQFDYKRAMAGDSVINKLGIDPFMVNPPPAPDLLCEQRPDPKPLTLKDVSCRPVNQAMNLFILGYAKNLGFKTQWAVNEEYYTKNPQVSLSEDETKIITTEFDETKSIVDPNSFIDLIDKWATGMSRYVELGDDKKAHVSLKSGFVSLIKKGEDLPDFVVTIKDIELIHATIKELEDGKA